MAVTIFQRLTPNGHMFRQIAGLPFVGPDPPEEEGDPEPETAEFDITNGELAEIQTDETRVGDRVFDVYGRWWVATSVSESDGTWTLNCERL